MATEQEIDINEIEDHPAAGLLPKMSQAQLDGLMQDIGMRGQREKIVVYQGKLLDGRSRREACKMLNRAPEWKSIDADVDESFDPYSYVISLNLKRRHLNDRERKSVAAKYTKLLEGDAKERQKTGKSADGKAGGRGKKKPAAKSPQGKKSRQVAASAMNVSERGVQEAIAVLDKGSPDLQAAVDANEVSLAAGAKVARTEPPEKQLEAARTAPRNGRPTEIGRPRNPVQKGLANWWAKAKTKDKKWFRAFIRQTKGKDTHEQTSN
jgi:hypothetical protein